MSHAIFWAGLTCAIFGLMILFYKVYHTVNTDTVPNVLSFEELKKPKKVKKNKVTVNDDKKYVERSEWEDRHPHRSKP
jgi:hypothetical protein